MNTLRLVDRLNDSFYVQEAEAGEYIEKLEEVMYLIRKLLLEGDLFTTTSDILAIIDKVLENGD